MDESKLVRALQIIALILVIGVFVRGLILPVQEPAIDSGGTSLDGQVLGERDSIDVGVDVTKQQDRELLEVLKIVDGDTIKVEQYGTLRLIGLDTPETKDPRKDVQCWGLEATAQAELLLENQLVYLEFDESQGRVDRYGRTLAYVYRSDGILYNLQMIQEGFAREYTYNSPYTYQQAFKQAEQNARENDLGLWNPLTCNGGNQESTYIEDPIDRSLCEPSYPDVCIKTGLGDINCRDIPFVRVRVLSPDPYGLDGNQDGVGCV